jgi:hypothetical protein
MLCIWHALSRCNSAEDKKAATWSKSNRNETVYSLKLWFMRKVIYNVSVQCYKFYWLLIMVVRKSSK